MTPFKAGVCIYSALSERYRVCTVMKYLSTMFAIYNLLDMTDLVAKPNVVIQLPYKLAGKPLVQHITQFMERHNTTIS